MRITVLFFFCSIISFSASAQWWKLKFKKQPPRQVEPMEVVMPPKLPGEGIAVLKIRNPHLLPHKLSLSDLALESAQAAMIKTAQHNMRYRIYNKASYNFADLAQLYVKQNRFSEAKWYFLQSTYLSRKQNDHKLTVSNLIKLAMVKLEIGDQALAYQDLLEARDIASSKGWLIDLIEIEKKLGYLQRSRFAALRTNRYDDELVTEN